MSDFIYTSELLSREALEHSLNVLPPDVRSKTHFFQGDWGSLISSEGPYCGFLPLETESHIFLIVGGPVLRFRDNSFLVAENSRAATEAVYQRWQANQIDWSEDLSGPFAALLVDKNTGVVSTITDLMSFIPVYRHHSEARTVIGSHVDAVASIAGEKDRVDRFSAADFVLHGLVTYPYTLYANINQISPASIHELTVGSRSNLEGCYWTPPSASTKKPIQDVARNLRESLQEYVGLVASGMDGVASFISGGEDSRVVMSLLSRVTKNDAYIFLEGMNPEGKVAQKASEIFGARFFLMKRDEERYLRLLPQCSDLVGSGSQYAHAHTYEYHISAGLVNYSAVFGGFASDRLLKGEHTVLVRGSGRVLFFPEIADTKSYKPDKVSDIFSDDIISVVKQRRREHWDRVFKLRGKESADEWFNVWPSSMAVGAPNIHANRRLFRSYEPFLDCRVVKLACEIPQSWKLNRRVFRQVAAPLLLPAKWLLHVKGWSPLLPFWANSPLKLYFRIIKSLRRKLGNSDVHDGPWLSRRKLVRNPMWFAFESAVEGQAGLCNLFSASGGDFHSWYTRLAWKQKLIIFQMAHNLGLIDGKKVVEGENRNGSS